LSLGDLLPPERLGAASGFLVGLRLPEREREGLGRMAVGLDVRGLALGNGQRLRGLLLLGARSFERLARNFDFGLSLLRHGYCSLSGGASSRRGVAGGALQAPLFFKRRSASRRRAVSRQEAQAQRWGTKSF